MVYLAGYPNFDPISSIGFLLIDNYRTHFTIAGDNLKLYTVF